MSTRPNGLNSTDAVNQQYAELVANIDGIVWEVDTRTFQFTFVSQQAERLLGYPSKQWLTSGFWAEHLHPDDRAWALEFCLRATCEKRSHDFEYRMIAANGRTVWLRDIVSVVVEGETATKLRGIMVDVTDRRNAEEALRRREADLKLALDAGRLGEWSWDLITGQITWSPLCKALYGLPPDADVNYERFLAAVHPDDRAGVDAALKHAVAMRSDYEVEIRVVWPDGSLHWNIGRGRVLCDDDGQPARITGVTMDITERKRTEDLLNGQKEVLELIAAGATLPESLTALVRLIEGHVPGMLGSILLLDEEGVHLRHCAAPSLAPEYVAAIDGVSIGPCVGSCGTAAYCKEAVFVEDIATNPLWNEYKAVALPHGLRACWSTPIFDAQRQVLGTFAMYYSQPALPQPEHRRLIGLATDTAAIAIGRHRTEAALRESAERLRLSVHASNVGLWDWNFQSNHVDFSREWKSQLGYEEGEVGNNYSEWERRLHPDDLAPTLAALHDYLDGKYPKYAVEFRLRHKDGSYRWIYARGEVLRDTSGKPVRMLGCHVDITERKREQEALNQSHAQLHDIIESTPDAIFIKDRHGRYVLMNSAGADLVGKSVAQVVGAHDTTLFTPETAQALQDRDRQIIATGIPQTIEEVVTAAGVTRTYLVTKSPHRDSQGTITGIIGIARDVTEIKRLEEQFRQSQKMEAVGRLAGGVAHDFNNLLTIINGYGELLLSELPTGDPARELIGEMVSAGERAAGLTRQLLAFSRNAILEPKVLDLNDSVRETGKLLRRLIGEDIILASVLDPVISKVKVDPDQLGQVLMNLAVNARDAMPKGGKLTIRTSNVELDDHYAATNSDCMPGPYVLLALSDTGYGMTPDVKARVFEPFFTTKGVGKGTGLGLAMVFGMVKQSGGFIDVNSEPGYGSTFKIFLPAVSEASGTPNRSDSDHGADGTETVLLVEDEDGVRGLALRVLRSHGYNVLAAANGKEAMRAVDEHDSSIDLLLTDVVMPGMDGRDLAEVLLPRFPRMKVLFSSGYTDDDVMRHGILHEEVSFLQKPYSPRSLARKVRKVLDEK